MEEIGSVVSVKQQETIETIKQATHFKVLEFKVIPHNHEIHAEVCLMDVDGIAIGPAQWVKLNPIETEQGDPPEFVEQDNWAAFIGMAQEIIAKVKARLQGMEF